jgi:hypothetical protein
VDWLAVAEGSLALLGDEELVAHGVVEDARDHLTVGIGCSARWAMLEAHGDAENREAVGEVGGAVERIDVPAVGLVESRAGALFAVDAVLGEGGGEAVEDELFAGAVGLGNEIDIGFVFGSHAACVEVAEQCAGFEGDGSSFMEEIEGDIGWKGGCGGWSVGHGHD